MSDHNEYISEDDTLPPEPLKVEITFKDVELTKLDVKQGDTLVMVVKSDDIEGVTIGALKENFAKAFPGVRILIMGMGLNDAVNFTAISENKADKEISSCATGNFCVDCNCGKKEAYEDSQS